MTEPAGDCVEEAVSDCVRLERAIAYASDVPSTTDQERLLLAYRYLDACKYLVLVRDDQDREARTL